MRPKGFKVPKTKPKSQSALLGGLFAAGTAIGAGMLAMPTGTAGVWFGGSFVLLIVSYLAMTASALMILEANCKYPHGSTFNTMVKDLLGNGWNVICGVSFFLALALAVHAYISSAGEITSSVLSSITNTTLPVWAGQVIFTLFFATFVWLSSSAVNRLSAVLLAGMILTFLLSNSALIVNASPSILWDSSALRDSNYGMYLLYALPIIIFSFDFHGNVSSLFKHYRGNAHKVRTSIIIGSTCALIFFLAWQYSVQGNLPREAFGPVVAADGSVDILLQNIAKHVNIPAVNNILGYFAYFAITTSFLGISISIFDYLSDLFKLKNNRAGRTQAAVITFVPILLASIFFPGGFVTIVAYSGLLTAVYTLIVPALLAWKVRKSGQPQQWRTFGGNIVVWGVFAFGVLVIVAQLLYFAGALPTFSP